MATERPGRGRRKPGGAAAAEVDAARTLAVLSRLLERSLDDMTLPQLRILLLIARAPERANRLATQAAVSRPSLTGVLDGLVGRGWVRRVDVARDRRGVQLEVTPAGRRALTEAQDAVAARLDDLLTLVAPERRAVALEGMAALGEAIDAELARRRTETTDAELARRRTETTEGDG